MSKYIIKQKGNEYPYFTDAIEDQGDKITFQTETRGGRRRKVELLKSEIASKEEEITETL